MESKNHDNTTPGGEGEHEIHPVIASVTNDEGHFKRLKIQTFINYRWLANQNYPNYHVQLFSYMTFQ